MSKAEVRMWNEKSHATQGHNILNPSQADSLNMTPAASLCLFMGVSGWDRGCFTTWELYSLFSTLTFKKTWILSPQQSISTADKNLAEFIAPPSESSYNPLPYFPHTLDLNLSFTYFFSPVIVWILPLKAPPWHTMVSVLRAGSNLSDGFNARKYHFVTIRTLPKSLSLSNVNLYFTETTAFNNVKISFWHLGNGTPLFKKKEKEFCISLYSPGDSVNWLSVWSGKKRFIATEFPEKESFSFSSTSHPFFHLHPAEVAAEKTDNTTAVATVFIHLTCWNSFYVCI